MPIEINDTEYESYVVENGELSPYDLQLGDGTPIFTHGDTDPTDADAVESYDDSATWDDNYTLDYEDHDAISWTDTETYAGSGAVEWNVDSGTHGGHRYEWDTATNLGSAPESIHMRFWVYLPSSWSFADSYSGVKCMGISSPIECGWGNQDCDTSTAGFSVRGELADPDNVGAGPGDATMDLYVYHSHMESTGDWLWNESSDFDTSIAQFTFDTWTQMDVYVELNDPGVENGVTTLWVDGQEAGTYDGWQFRDSGDDFGITTHWLGFYFGGSEPSPEDNTLYVDETHLWANTDGTLPS